MFCECGTGSFKHVDEDPEVVDLGCAGGSPSPRGRTKKHAGGGKVNPYAGRGLDRFSDVLSELEAQRAKILRRVVGSGDAAGLVLVRFAVKSNGGWAPVVVKLPEKPLKGKGAVAAKKSPRAKASSAVAPLPQAAPASPASPREREEGGKKVIAAKVPARRASFSWGRIRRVWRPSCYLPAAIVLTLVSLAVFGRVFAICLTTIWWYVLPTVGSEDASRAGLRRSMEKKELVLLQSRAKNGSSWGVHETAISPRAHAKGKRG